MTLTKIGKKRVIAVAYLEFFKHGYHATSIQHLADKLGVAKATIYYYVKTKEELLIKAIDFVWHQFQAQVKNGDDPFVEYLYFIIKMRFEMQRYKKVSQHLASIFNSMEECWSEEACGMHELIVEIVRRGT